MNEKPVLPEFIENKIYQIAHHNGTSVNYGICTKKFIDESGFMHVEFSPCLYFAVPSYRSIYETTQSLHRYIPILGYQTFTLLDETNPKHRFIELYLTSYVKYNANQSKIQEELYTMVKNTDLEEIYNIYFTKEK